MPFKVTSGINWSHIESIHLEWN